jgi:hypothetical protein
VFGFIICVGSFLRLRIGLSASLRLFIFSDINVPLKELPECEVQVRLSDKTRSEHLTTLSNIIIKTVKLNSGYHHDHLSNHNKLFLKICLEDWTHIYHK